MTVDRSTRALSLVGGGSSAAVSRRPPPAPSADDMVSGSAADAVAARTVQILRRAGIQSVLLNGPATAGMPHPYGASRRPVVEVLVAPWAVTGAQQLLRHHQYGRTLQGVRAGQDPREVSVWTVPERSDLALSLYCGFAGVQDAERFFSELWKSRRVVPLAGIDVCVPGAGGAALLLLLRAAVAAAPADRIAEIRAAASVLGTMAWVEAGVLARQIGARDAVAVGAAVVPAGPVEPQAPSRPDAPARWLRGRDEPASSAADGPPARSGWTIPTKNVVRQVLPSLRGRIPLS